MRKKLLKRFVVYIYWCISLAEITLLIIRDSERDPTHVKCGPSSRFHIMFRVYVENAFALF